ncbi:MAG TPA: GAF domain-containing protein, partial [Planctomycetota bacterium]|nr:GAF domain-containing protein [Planctomycetota bacterium]
MIESASPPVAPPARSIVWRMDTRSLKLQFLSRDVEALLGIPCERFYEPGFWPSCIHPDDRARTLDLVARGASGEAVPEIEYRVQTATGQTLWFRTVVRLTGVPGELLGVTFDHTARRRADALLAGDLRILEMVAQARPLTEVLRVLVEVIEEWSEGMIASILRLEDGVRVRHVASSRLPVEFTRAIDGQAIGPEHGSCGTAAFRRETVIVEDIATDPLWARYREHALPQGLRACWSVPIKAPDGTVLGTFALYYKEARRPTPILLELARHAAHLASIAMERERREEALRISEEHRSLIYRHVEDVLFHLRIEPGGEYRFASMNPAFTKSTGLPASQVIGKSVREVIPEPSLSMVLSNYERAIRTNRTVRWDEESRYPTGDRLGEVTITPVFDAEGHPQCLVGSVHDLTERRKLEEENRQLQKLEAVGRLTGGVAHDLNNLLTVILGYGTILQGQLPTDSALRGDLEEILGAGRRASDLTRQLLAFARKQTLEPRRIDLSKLVAGLEKLLRRLIRENISFRHSLANDLAPVLADPGQIEQ